MPTTQTKSTKRRALNVLVVCECSGAVRRAFRKLGHNAWSCDLQPADDGSPYHYEEDCFTAVARRRWDLVVAHPPCTFLSRAGLHWNTRRPGRAAKTREALAFVRRLMALDVPRLAIENPVGCISTRIRRYSQMIQPYGFGDDASKATCLWLRGLPNLEIDPAKRLPGRIVEWPSGSGRRVERWGNQTDSGQNRVPPSKDRAKLRSITYTGIAEAMADQWGGRVV